MTFGQKLRREREARGITLEQVATATKIVRRYLEALEANDFESLPGDVFTKGYVRAFAEFIGLDPEALVLDYVAERGTPVESDDAKDDPLVREMSRVLKSVPRSSRGGTRSPLGTIVVFLGALVAVVTLAWVVAGFLRPESITAPTPTNVARARQAEPEQPARQVVPPPAEKVQPATGPVPVPPVVDEPIARPKPVEPEPEPEPPPAKPVETTPPPPPPPAPSPPPPSLPPPAPPPEKPKVTPPPSPPPPVPTSLIVSESGVGTDVVDHRLVGESDTFPLGTDVFFWTRVLRGKAGDSIRHVWTHEGREVFSIDLEIGSANWRTQSRKKLTAGSIGGWTVEARDATGRLLARAAFVCISP